MFIGSKNYGGWDSVGFGVSRVGVVVEGFYWDFLIISVEWLFILCVVGVWLGLILYIMRFLKDLDVFFLEGRERMFG